MNWKFVTIVSGNLTRKLVLFFVIVSSFFVSCNNEHCDEVMNTPLRIDLYSYTDTSKKAHPISLIMQGIGSDSILDFSQKSQIQLPLNKSSNKSDFLMAFTYIGAKQDILTFLNDSTFINNTTNDTLVIEKKVGNICFTNGFNSALYKYHSIDSVNYIYLRPIFDTLSVRYYNQDEFISAECGCLSSQILLNVELKRETIGEVEQLRTLINNQNNEAQVKIFLNYD